MAYCLKYTITQHGISHSDKVDKEMQVETKPVKCAELQLRTTACSLEGHQGHDPQCCQAVPSGCLRQEEVQKMQMQSDFASTAFVAKSAQETNRDLGSNELPSLVKETAVNGERCK